MSAATFYQKRLIYKRLALFDVPWRPRPWPLLPFTFTFRRLEMPFYECGAPEFVAALFGRIK